MAQAEAAYFAVDNRKLDDYVGLFDLDGGLFHEAELNPESYLLDMTQAGRDDYAAAIASLAADFERVRQGIGRAGKAEFTARCFRQILDDISRIESGQAA